MIIDRVPELLYGCQHMAYIYHGVPANLRGDMLMPLNTLRDVYPDLYEQHVAKYRGREHVLELTIPPLGNCPWNDVLFFTPVNPADIKRELDILGVPFAKDYYKVDTSLLDPALTTIWLWNKAGKRDFFDDDEFIPYSDEAVSRLGVISEVTKEWWREEAPEGRIKLLYRRIPHILYRGTLKVEGLEVVSV